MSWTNPRTWAPNELITDVIMNTHVRDELRYLKGQAGPVALEDSMSITGFFSVVSPGDGSAVPAGRFALTNGVGVELGPYNNGTETIAYVQGYNRVTQTAAPLALAGSRVIVEGAPLLIGKATGLTGVGDLDMAGHLKVGGTATTGVFAAITPNGNYPAGRFVFANGAGIELAPYTTGTTDVGYVQAYNRTTQVFIPLILAGTKIVVEAAPLLVGKASGLTGVGDLDIAGTFKSDSGSASFGGAGVLWTGATNGQALVWSSANNRWQAGTIAGGGGGGSGTVTSVALSLPSIFSVTGSPVTASGTLSAALATQSAKTFFRGPTSGSAAAPTFAAFTLTDLPQGGATDGQALLWSAANSQWQPGSVTGGSGGSGTVTSVGFNDTSGLFTVGGSPITTSGTLSLTLNVQLPNKVFATPASGSGYGSVSYRALVAADIPALDAAKITSGVFAVTRLPALVGATSSVAGTAGIVPAPAAGDDTKFLRGDGTWQTVAGGGGGSGSVTSVALSLPNIFSVTGSPVTSSGTLTATLASQAAASVLAAPTGAAGVPIFRVLAATDIPNLDASKIVSGALGITNGGTGATTASAAYAALSPLTTRGDLVVRNATAPARLALGTSGQVLRSNGTDPAWSALVASDLPAANIFTSGTSFPGSPVAGQRFYRTDRRRDYFYDGTRWLSEAYYIPFVGDPALVVPYTATCYPGVATMPSDVYLLEFGGYFYVNGTNNASNYWRAELIDDATASSYVATSTSASAANSIVQFAATAFASNPIVRSSSVYAFDVLLTKVGSPGTAYFYYYLRVCDVG